MEGVYPEVRDKSSHPTPKDVDGLGVSHFNNGITNIHEFLREDYISDGEPLTKRQKTYSGSERTSTSGNPTMPNNGMNE